MKYTFLFIGLLPFYAFAQKDALQIAQKYCNQKVKVACDIMKCHKSPDSCKNSKPDKATVNEVQNKIKELDKFCPKDDYGCLMQKLHEDAEAPLKELEKECNKGNKEACFEKEYMSAIPGLVS